MDNFDNGIKRELKKHVRQNIYFTENEREKILESAVKRKQKYIGIKLLSVTAFTLAVFTLLVIPFFANPEDNIIHKISSLPFSDKELDSKEDFPDSLFEEKEEDINHHSENDNSESEKNENAVTQDEEPNKEVDVTEKQKNSDKDQGKNQVEFEEKPTSNTDGNIEKGDNQTKDLEEIFLNLVRKFNNMDNQIFSFVDYEDHASVGAFFKKFTKKNQVYEQLLDYITYEEAERLWASRLTIEENRLVMVATEGHPEFYLDQPYTINKISERKYDFVQEIEPGLFGPVISLKFTKVDGKWLISNSSY